ncbi:hypothetical protein GYMLUDRAFT_155419 [Collybiopsis luxurians FD-317 M1]|nr:hypothetical protein GYMLUDRAFT_155419 [Collybiopsis luxurians FD-317 M1]
MSGAEKSIRLLLQPSDDIKFVLECFLLRDNAAQDEGEFASRYRRTIAVITHKDQQADSWEEGSVFVFKPKSTGSELEVYRIFPIYGGNFSISMAQLKQETLDLNHPNRHSSGASAGFEVTIHPGHNLIGSEPLDLATYDILGLKNVVAECKRLKELSDIVPEARSPTKTYSWLESYTSDSIYIPSLVSSFPDLRDIRRPFRTRLSSTSAGIPGDELGDLTLIRDHWARVRARNECRKGRIRLNLRLGTFNVNGKMPSQDLAAWIQGNPAVTQMKSTSGGGPLPAVKQISPLSLGEIVKDPFDSQVTKDSSLGAALNSPAISVSEPPEVPIISVDPLSKDPDILVLGFEELDLSTEALLYSTSTAREDAWTLAIFAALGEKAERYEKLCSKQLVGMLIIIIVKKSLRSCFSDIMSTSAGAGIMGLMGNKGATAIRLTFTPASFDALNSALSPVVDGADQRHHGIENPGSTVITFTVSHLAAFDEMAEKRNADFHDLSKRLIFNSSLLASPSSSGTSANGDKSLGLSASPANGTEPAAPGGMIPSQTLVTVPEKSGVFESDILFWMVNLNYRINLPDADVRELLRSETWKNSLDILLQYDQLRTAMRNKKAFDIFFEHNVRHLPTYRFSSGLTTDSMGYDTKRKPAFTDRILYAFSPLTARVDQSSYSCHPSITFSDHRPLSADFGVDVDLYDKDQLHATATNLFRQVQRMEEVQERAKAKLSHSLISLGDLLCVMAKIPPTSADLPEWLSASHETGLLLPNELIEITLTAFVDNSIASRLNLGSRDLSFTLILHSFMGKDHFISITAKYHYTCFANRLSRLTKLPGPIRKLESHNHLLDEDRAINAPREIMRLVNWLITCAHPAEELFTAEADPEIVDDIREHLDTGDEFPYSHNTREHSISIAFGAALINFLDSLPECIIPPELHERCASVGSRDEAFEMLDFLSPETVNVWISVTAFLHYFVQKEGTSSARAESICAYTSSSCVLLIERGHFSRRIRSCLFRHSAQ